MAHISSVSETARNAALTRSSAERIRNEDCSIRESSSIASLKATACLTSIFTWPFRVMGKLIRGIFSLIKFVCCCGKEDKIDWKNTEKILAKISASATNSTDPAQKRQKALNTLILQLEEDCPPAIDRFREHMAFAYAKKAKSIHERAEQEKWAAENIKNVPCNDILTNVDNPILQEAVRGFFNECLSKTSQS